MTRAAEKIVQRLLSMISFVFSGVMSRRKQMLNRRGVVKSLTVGLYVIGSVFLLLTARAWYQATVIPDSQRHSLVVSEPFEYGA